MAECKAKKPDNSFEIIIPDDEFSRCLGMKANLVLIVEGEKQTIERVNLESARPKKIQANDWSRRFGIDGKKALARLDEIAMRLREREAEQLSHAGEAPTRRIIDVADSVLSRLQPAWRRKDRAVYLGAIGVESAIGNLWNFAKEEEIASVRATVEGRLSGSSGQPAKPQACLQLLRDALVRAIRTRMLELPEICEMDIPDPEVSPEDLLDQLVHVLTKPRTFHDQSAPITESLLDWANRVALGPNWTQRPGLMFFARRKDTKQPELACRGEWLNAEMKSASKRRLSSDLKAAELVLTGREGTSLKLSGGKFIKAWLINQTVIQSVETVIEDKEDAGNEDTA